jgi:hypothetical protein
MLDSGFSCPLTMPVWRAVYSSAKGMEMAPALMALNWDISIGLWLTLICRPFRSSTV